MSPRKPKYEPPAGSGGKEEEYLIHLLSMTREELVRADAKAAVLLAGAGVAIGAVLSGLIARSWAPFALDNRIEWLWWIGALLALFGIFKLGSAIFPSTQRTGVPPKLIAYYGDVQAYKNRPAAELRKALEDTARQGPSYLLDQIVQISNIAALKYFKIRQSMIALGLSAAACGAAVFLNSLA